MARRLGSAMISKTDSTRLIYAKEYIRVKIYTQRGRRRLPCLESETWGTRLFREVDRKRGGT